MEEKYTAVLCEKPSVARDVAAHLKASRKGDGYFYGNSWVVTWAFGHLVELCEPGEYKTEWKSWRLDSLPMIPEKFELKPKGDKGAKGQLKIVKKILKGADSIVCATDAGREGELIFRYIVEFCGVNSKPTKRLWVSSLTQEALAKGFLNLAPASGFDSLYMAAKCRSEADWIVGLNATRFYTVSRGGGSQLWSVGRVQSPVLAMVVKRDREIESFQSQDYWELHTNYKDILFKSVRGKIEKKDLAEELCSKLKTENLTIVSIETEEEKVLPPYLYDLTDLQKDLNRRFGLSADRTLKAAQSLYEKKHLTYPRTDSKFLTQDIAKNLPTLLTKLKRVKEKEISELNLSKLSLGTRVVNDLKVTDHHAIIPTEVIPGSLGPDEDIVYEAVVTRLLAALYPAGLKEVIKASAKVLDEEFKTRGVLHKSLGWEVLYPKKSESKNKRGKKIEEVSESDVYQHLLKITPQEAGPHDIFVKTLQSTPPLPFTEASLLQMMEFAGRQVEDENLKLALKDRGLGTPATRASIIETLLHRKYLERKKKNIISTGLGKELIDYLHDPRLKSPELTGEWELRLKKIERGEDDAPSFMQDVVTFVSEMTGNKRAEAGHSTSVAAKGLGPCPLCEAPVIEGKRGYGCSQWKQGCRFVLWKLFNETYLLSEHCEDLLKKGRTSVPVHLLVDGRPSWAYIQLSKEGTLRIEPAAEDDPGLKRALQNRVDIVGLCPSCGGFIEESEKAYGCSKWREGCRFKIWKTVAKRAVDRNLAKKILESGRSPLLDGFKSKAGKDFSAQLVVHGDGVKFDFS